jgi:hypothetical protein
VLDVESEQIGFKWLETTKALTEQDRCTAKVATLQMDVGDGNLQEALKPTTAGALGFMPELLESVVTGIPTGLVEQVDRLPEAVVGHEGELLRVVAAA